MTTRLTVEIVRTDGSTDTFRASDVETVNDVAFVDGVLQTNVADVSVHAPDSDKCVRCDN
jgi:hypothetical protein